MPSTENSNDNTLSLGEISTSSKADNMTISLASSEGKSKGKAKEVLLPKHLEEFKKKCASSSPATEVSQFYQKLSNYLSDYKKRLQSSKPWLFTRVHDIRLKDVEELEEELLRGPALTEFNDARLISLCQKIAEQPRDILFGRHELLNFLHSLLMQFASGKIAANLTGNADSEQIHKELYSARQEVARLEGENIALSKKNTALETKNIALNDKIKTMEDNIKSLTSLVENNFKENVEIKRENAEFKENLNKIMRKLDITMQENAELKKENAELKKENAEKFNTISLKLNMTMQENAEIKNENAELKKTLDGFSPEFKLLRTYRTTGNYNPSFFPSSSNTISKDTPPEMLKCPITHELMLDPVVAQDGHTYERQIIESWFERKNTSPMTGKEIGNVLTPNYAIKEAIGEFLRKSGVGEQSSVVSSECRI